MTSNRLSLEHFVPYRLTSSAALVGDAVASSYKSLFALAIPEWRLIAVAAEHDGITQQAVCARTRMDKVTVSRAARVLVKRGLLTRMPNMADRRSHLLVLSEAGLRLYTEVAPKALELERHLFGDLTPAEMTIFLDLLRRTDAKALQVLANDPAEKYLT